MVVILSEAKNPESFSLPLTGFFVASLLRMTENASLGLTVQLDFLVRNI